MITDAAQQGAYDAVARFRIRSASALATLLGTLGAGAAGSIAKGALSAASPRLMAGLENLGAAPVNAIRRAVTPSPASAIAKHLNSAMPAALPMKPRIM